MARPFRCSLVLLALSFLAATPAFPQSPAELANILFILVDDLSHAAPHFPWQGPDDREVEVRPKTKSWKEGDRATYVAMVERMDTGIGEVLDRLDELGLRERTLVVNRPFGRAGCGCPAWRAGRA